MPSSASLFLAGPAWSHAGSGVWGTARAHLLRWGVPVCASASATLLTAWLQPVLTPGRFVLFLAAVVVGAGFGGFPAGLVATVLGALGHIYLLLPLGGAGRDPSSWYGLAVFIPVALLISGLIGALQAAHLEAHRLAKALHERVLELVEVDRRKDEFLGVLGHELRNPLGTVAQALRVLHLRDDVPTVQWARAVAERQLDLLARLVDDLLDSARLVRGRLLLHRDRMDLVEMVRETTADYGPALEEAGLHFCRELPAEPVWIEGDRTRLAQVLGNLLHNAIKFTDPGGAVHVRLTVDGEHRRAVLTIQDTGIGIDPAMLPRVFETYAQGERALGRNRDGLGLGLALVRALIELHGGTVCAQSDGPGCGAEFSCSLPLLDDVPAVPTPLRPEASTAPMRPLCVLIIEDNRDAAESLKMLLGLSGHDVVVAHSGPAGVALARQLRPDAILCDLGLPGMNGFAVAQTLRHEPATAATRLVALTGYTGDEDRGRCREAGFNAILLKPVDWPELEQLLTEASSPSTAPTGTSG